MRKGLEKIFVGWPEWVFRRYPNDLFSSGKFHLKFNAKTIWTTIVFIGLLVVNGWGYGANNALLDLTLNNERGPLSILLKFQGQPVGPLLKNEDRTTWVLTLPNTELTFQKGRYHKISVGGLGVNEIEVMPVEKGGEKLVRLEVQVQEGFSLVNRSEAGTPQMRLEILPLPGGREKPLEEKAVPETPKVPVEPLKTDVKSPGKEIRATDPDALKPMPVGPIPKEGSQKDINQLPLIPLPEEKGGVNQPLLLDSDLKGIPFAEELLLGTDASNSGPETAGPIEKRLLTTRISNLAFRQADLQDVFSLLALKGRFNIVVDPKVTGQVTLTLNQVSIKEALDVMGRISNIEYKVFDNTIVISQKKTSEDGKSEEGLVTEVIELNYASPETVKEMLDKLKLVKNGSLEVISNKDVVPKSDSRPDSVLGNILVVRETPEIIREIRKVCRKLDRKPRQVHIAVRFVELETNGANEYISRMIGARGTSKAPGFSGIAVDEEGNFFEPIDDWVGSTLNGDNVDGDIFKYGILGAFKGYNFAAMLKMLIQERLLEVVASPNLMTIDGKQGTVDITDKVTYFETGTVTDGGGTTAARKTVDFGVKMLVIPRIDSEGSVTMVVEPEVVTPGPVRNGVPDEKTKKVKLTVRVKSGETLVLGGLISKTDEETVLKTPLLGDLPILKKLFRSRSKTSEKKELVVFLTPTIVEEE